ncbi:hypothetical protein HO675_05090 [Streptococcus suis]|nr:hypothetical protein [Streptococcus suis]
MRVNLKKLNLVLAAIVCLLQAGCQIQQVTVENVVEGTATTEKNNPAWQGSYRQISSHGSLNLVEIKNNAEFVAIDGSGEEVQGSWKSQKYDSDKKVTSLNILALSDATIYQTLPEVMVTFLIKGQDMIFYGFQTEFGQRILTSGGKNTIVFKDEESFPEENDEDIFPEGLIGSWTGIHPLTHSGWSLIFEEDGGIRNTLYVNGERFHAIAMYEVRQNFYVFENERGDHINFGIANIGGTGIVYDFGIYIDPDYSFIQPFYITADINESFDYDKIEIDSQSSMNLYPGDRILLGKSAVFYIPKVDTKNLTQGQLENWVLASYALSMHSTVSYYRDMGWHVVVKNAEDGLVYASLIDETQEEVWLYRVNAMGELESHGYVASGERGSTWFSLGKVYYE